MKKFLSFSPLFLLIFSGCEFNVSTANLSNVKTCTELNTNDMCKNNQAVLPAQAEELFVTAQLNNAPDGTKIQFDWRYLEGEGIDIDSVEVITEGMMTTVQSSLSQPDNGWPTGNYEVVLSLGTDNSEPIHKTFRVE